jgi:5-methylcytosine-specific restriction endonuclease McrA
MTLDKMRLTQMPNQYTNDPRQVPRVCRNCGKSFSTYRSFLKTSGRPFCSRQCKTKAGQVARRCERCRRSFTVPKSHFRDKGQGKYCSRACITPTKAMKRMRKAAAMQRHRARKRSAKGTATAEQIAARIAMWGGRCYLCGDQATTLDHVIPLVRGGTNWPANLRPACWPCNLGKGRRSLASVLLSAAR